MSQIRSMMESVGVYLPPKVVSTSTILEGCAHRILVPLERLTGIATRRVAGETEWGYDLAVKAVQDCLAHSRYGPEDMDIVINCNISHADGPDQYGFEPSRSVRLCKTFGIRNALAFDLTNACAGMFTGIYLVDACIRAGVVRRGLVVSGEYITQLTETAQKEIKGLSDPRLACLTLGDSGAAVLVDAAPAGSEAGFHALDLFTMGRHSPLCIAKVTEQPHGGVVMVTDMIQLANLSVAAFLRQSTQVLARLGWHGDQIQHVLPHQTSRTTLDTGSRTVKRLIGDRGLKIDKDKLINNVADRGNTATTSHFVALMDSIASGRIRSGDGIVFGVLASGITVGTAVYRFDDLPRRLAGWRPDQPAPAPPAAVVQGGAFTRRAGAPRVRLEAVGLLGPDREGASDTLSMLAEASRACLRQSSHPSGDVDVLLHTGLYRTGFLTEPAIASLLAGLLKINDDPAIPGDRRSLAFDLLNGGLGFLNACYIATILIGTKTARRILVTASEVENNAKPVPDCLRGVKETASAVMLDADQHGQEGFGAFHFQHFPEHQDALAVHGSAHRLQVGGRHLARLHIAKEPDLETRMIRCIAETVSTFLAGEGIGPDDLAVVLPPQVSPGFIAALAGALHMDPNRFVDVSRPEGDLFTSSLPYGFAAIGASHPGVNPGDLGLVINVAAGIEVGCAIYHF
jgi:3-oxoacyl-[acyl-carrier-protein] synthase III